MKRLSGADGHNLRLLLSLTDIEDQLEADKDAKKDWAVCIRWKSTWRYDPTYVELEDAQEFVGSGFALLRMAETSFLIGRLNHEREQSN